MKRDVVITALLIIAGIILAFVLFGAGAFWQGGSSLWIGPSAVQKPLL